MSLCGGDGAKWASKVHAQFASQAGRSKMYDSLFTLRHMKGTKDASFLMTNDLVTAFKPAVPSELQLREMDKGIYENITSFIAKRKKKEKKKIDINFLYLFFLPYSFLEFDISGGGGGFLMDPGSLFETPLFDWRYFTVLSLSLIVHGS